MDQYVALDISLREVSVCVLDATGAVVFEGRSPSDPRCLAALIRSKAPRAVKVGLETGSTSTWLAHALLAEGLPVVCMDARHAHAALSIRPTKTDRSDARGLAEMVRVGWYRAVAVKSLEAHERRALLAARHRLVVMRVDLDGQIRGLLKTFGLIVGPGNSDAFLRRAEALAEGHPVLSPLVTCLSEVRRHVAAQISALDKQIGRIVRNDTTLRRFVTVPGVGPITALAFLSTIDDPSRFRRARISASHRGVISPVRSIGRAGSRNAVMALRESAFMRPPPCYSPRCSVGRRSRPGACAWRSGLGPRRPAWPSPVSLLSFSAASGVTALSSGGRSRRLRWPDPHVHHQAPLQRRRCPGWDGG